MRMMGNQRKKREENKIKRQCVAYYCAYISPYVATEYLYYYGGP